MGTVLASSPYDHFRLCREAEVAAVQAEHDSAEHITVASSGSDHSDLPSYLNSIAAGAAGTGLRGLPVDSATSRGSTGRSPSDEHVPLVPSKSRGTDIASVRAAADRLAALQSAVEQDPPPTDLKPSLERARLFVSLFAEEFDDLQRAAARVESLSEAQLAQAIEWASKLLSILDSGI